MYMQYQPWWCLKVSVSLIHDLYRSNIIEQIPLQLVGWLVVLRIYVALAVFQPYRDFEAGDNQSLKFKWRGRESNPGPLAPQAKSLTTRAPPILTFAIKRERKRSSSVLWRKPHTNRKFNKQLTTQKRQQKLRLHNDCEPTKDGQLE